MTRVILMGRLTADPDVRQTVTRFTLAVDRKVKTEGQPTADFISIVAFGKQAEFAQKFFHKGIKIALEGRINTGSYKKDGTTIYTTDVIAESFDFCESKKQEPEKQESEFVPIPDNAQMTLPFE